MTSRHSSLLCALVLLLGAGCVKPDEALRVTVRTDPAHADTCYEVELLDEKLTSLVSAKVPRLEGQDTYRVVVLRQNMPSTVKVRAAAWLGPGCEPPLRANGVSSVADFTFEPRKVGDVELDLRGGDTDLDGFAARAAGGLDCDDADETISPAAHEVCAGTFDHDCDGLSSCSDDDCAGQPCAGLPTQLVFTHVPTGVHPGECAGPLDLEVHDATNVLTSPLGDGPLELIGPVTFYAGPSCQGAALTQVTLTPTAGFSFRAMAVGSVTLGARAPGLGAASALLEVLPNPPFALAMGTLPLRSLAGGCSLELEVHLVDDGGVPAAPQGPLSLALSHDASGPFGFYVDPTCMTPASALTVNDAGSASFHFSGQKAGGFSFVVTEPTLGRVEQAALIDPASVDAVQLTLLDAGVVTVGDCAGPFVVTAQDRFGNAVTVGAVDLTVPDGGELFTSSACATPGPSWNFGARFPDEGTWPVSVTLGGKQASTNVLVRAPGPTGSTWRWPLLVNTGARAPFNGYAGYTLTATFDSRDDVDAGRLAANFGNLRVFFRSDGGWSELDRVVEAPNTVATRVRFRAQTDVANNAVDPRYAFFAGAFDGGVALADPNRVWLFFDDFEGGTPLTAKWTLRDGAWALATDRATSTSGTALKYPPESTGDRFISVPGLNEADVLFEASWNFSGTGSLDFAQCVRLQPMTPTQYETDLEGNTGWNLAVQNGASWTELVTNQSSTQNNTWTRISLASSAGELRVFKNGAQMTPGSGVYTAASPQLDAGTVGFRKHNLGGNSLWVDDVTVRRYTEPEPGVVVGAPFRTP